MNEIYECIYAYIYENNYSRERRPGQQIYTLSSGMSGDKVSAMRSAVGELGKAGLAQVDKTDGVRYRAEPEPEVDYGTVSYSYIPETASGYAVVARTNLRRSLKGKKLRGHHELAHAYMLRGIPDGAYAADYAFSDVYDGFTDIELDTGVEIPQGADYVVEKVPDTLDACDGARFESTAMSVDELAGLGDGARTAISEILCAAIAAKRDGKTAYVVYNPEDAELAREYIRAALKTMPADIANKFSFITCYDCASDIKRDICGVPTCDDDYIKSLSSKGYCVQIQGGGAVGCGLNKTAFTAFFEHADYADLERWYASAPDYFAQVRKIADLDSVMTLFENKTVRSASAEATRKMAELVCGCFDSVTRIHGELNEQLSAVSANVERLCGEYAVSSAPEVFGLITTLSLLYARCKPRFVDFADEVMRLVFRLTFGYGGQSEEARDKHFKFVAEWYGHVKSVLAADYGEFVKQAEREPDLMREFFAEFMLDANYADRAASVALDLLSVLLDDVETRFGARAELRDMLTERYVCAVAPKQTVALFERVFASRSGRTAKFDFALNKVLGVLAVDRNRQSAVREQFTKFVADNYIEDGVPYFCNAFSSVGNAEVIEAVLGGLLKKYIARDEASPEGMYRAYEKLNDLRCRIHAGTALSDFLMRDFASRVLLPDCVNAVRSVRVESLTETQVEHCKRLIAVAAEIEEPDVSGLVVELNALIGKYDVYCRSTAQEQDLTEFRYSFVLREFSLLGGRTAYNLLGQKQFIGKEALDKRLADEGITSGKPYKDERFTAVAEKTARAFLCDPEVSSQTKQRLCAKIREVHAARNVDLGVNIIDASRRILESTLLAVALFVAVGAVSLVINRFYEGGYFVSIYLAFPVLAAALAEVIYWSNTGDRVHNTLVTAAWQSGSIAFLMLAAFFAVQAALSTVL